MSTSILAVIPARGGSKGIPRKNLVGLNGKSLLAYTIDAIKGSSLVSKILLSSEDDEINEFANSMGLVSEYRRPATLATDESSIIDVVIHILDWLEFHQRYLPEAVLILQPTSPLRTRQDIDEAIEFYRSNHLESLTSVHRMKEHPYDCVRGIGDQWSYLTERSCLSTRRQDYKESFFYINGAIYIASLNFIRNNRCFVNETTFMYEMSPENGVDIDEYQDLQWANFLLQQNSLKNP